MTCKTKLTSPKIVSDLWPEKISLIGFIGKTLEITQQQIENGKKDLNNIFF